MYYQILNLTTTNNKFKLTISPVGPLKEELTKCQDIEICYDDIHDNPDLNIEAFILTKVIHLFMDGEARLLLPYINFMPDLKRIMSEYFSLTHIIDLKYVKWYNGESIANRCYINSVPPKDLIVSQEDIKYNNN